MNLSRIKMKVTFVIVMLCLPGLAFAGFSGGKAAPRGGATTTVAEFKDKCQLQSGGGLSGLIDMGVQGAVCDEIKFTLEGRITAQYDSDDFAFEDETGKVTVEIDNFRGVDVGPDNIVRLTGEADYDDGGLMFDVWRIYIVE